MLYEHYKTCRNFECFGPITADNCAYQMLNSKSNVSKEQKLKMVACGVKVSEKTWKRNYFMRYENITLYILECDILKQWQRTIYEDRLEIITCTRLEPLSKQFWCGRGWRAKQTDGNNWFSRPKSTKYFLKSNMKLI